MIHIFTVTYIYVAKNIVIYLILAMVHLQLYRTIQPVYCILKGSITITNGLCILTMM